MVVFAVLVGLTLFLSLRDFYSYQFGFTPDSIEYTLLAHSLIEGPSFGLIYTPDVPEPTHFPFVYPLLLVPFAAAAPNDFLLPQWLSLAATLTSGAILFWGWQNFAPGLSNRWRFACTAMFLLAPITLSHTRQILSEPIFTTFLLLSFWFAARVLASPPQRRDMLGLALVLFFMVFTRSVGWVFFGGIVLYLALALRGRFVRVGTYLAATFGALLLPVLALTPVTPRDIVPGTYLEQLVAYGPINPVTNPRPNTPPPSTSGSPANRQNKTNVPVLDPVTVAPETVLDMYYVQIHIHEDLRKVLLLTGGGELEPTLARQLNAPWILIVPGLAVVLLLVLGNGYWLKTTWQTVPLHMSLFQWGALVYLPVVLIWRGGGERLFYPIQPQLYLALLLGIVAVLQALGAVASRLWRALTPQRLKQATAGLIALLVGAWLCLAVVRDWNLLSSYTLWGDLHARTDPILQSTPPDAVLLSDWASLDFIMTGRRTILLPSDTRTTDKLETVIRDHHITYIVLATDETFRDNGINTASVRLGLASRAFKAMLASGRLERVRTTAFPLQILRVVP